MFEKKVLFPEKIGLTPNTQFGLDDVDLMLQAGLHAEKISITNSKKTLNSFSDILHYDQASHSAMRLNTIHDLILNGYTLRLFGAHQYSSGLAQLSEYIESITGRNTHINIYLTGPDVQGLAAHADPHDVLVYQLSGTKHWFVELEQGGAFHDFNIMPGQMLFMPQGIQHYAVNEDNSHSLHLSISLHGAMGKDIKPSAPHIKTVEYLESIHEYLVETCQSCFGVLLTDNPYLYLVPRILGKDLIFNSTQDFKEASIQQAVSQLLQGHSSSFELRGIEYLIPELLPIVFTRGISLTLKVQCSRGEVTSELVTHKRQHPQRSYFPSSLKHRLIKTNDCLWVLNPHCVLKRSREGYFDATASNISLSLPVELADRLQSGPTRLDNGIAQKLARHNVVVPALYENFQSITPR